MWYDILIDNEFIEYFSNESNTFTIIENGQKLLAPTFSRFADIVTGLTYACTLSNIKQSSMDYLRQKEPDVFRGYAFYKENQPSQDESYLAMIWQSIPTDQNTSRYDVDLEKLDAEQCAVLLMYPFFSRMGGSFEISFQEDGRLKKYLLALKEKSEKERQDV